MILITLPARLTDWGQHAAFMHKHQLAHLDISLRNLVTDFKGHYAYIDFELSRNFQGIPCPRIYNHRATEMPPECEDRGGYDPYKIDIWTLGVLLLRASQVKVTYPSPL